jgi:predicted transcriptional regulator
LRIDDILKIVDGKLVVEGKKDSLEIQSVCGSDMLSDALRYALKGALLITSLNQSQVIRTADIADIPAVLIVLGKPIPEDMRLLAEDKNVTIISSPHSLFTVCGKLYEYGIRSCREQQQRSD